MNLIILQDEVPVVNPELRAIKVFADIISRDRGSAGDSQGRKKSQALREMAFIYWKYHPTSKYREIFTDKEIDEALAKDLDMPEGWKEDGVVKRAGIYYASIITNSISLKTLSTARAALFSANNVLQKYQELTEEVIDEITIEKMDTHLKNVSQLMNACKSLPDLVKTVEDLREKVSKEVANSSLKSKKEIDSMQIPED